MKKFYTPEKFMLLVSFIILTVASVLSFFLEPCKTTIIPFPQYTVPFINSFSALFCFFLFFKPSFYKGQCLILIIQSITTTLTGYEILGTFLYFAAILILFCEGYFKNNFKQKILFIIVCWFVVTLGVIPFGFHRFILELAVSLFFLGFYIFLYSKLKDLLKSLLPSNLIETTVCLPPIGSKITLSKFYLSERQIKILEDYMESKPSYSNLAYKHCLSNSSVKKEMSKILKIFGVSNANDLYFLLRQYELIYS